MILNLPWIIVAFVLYNVIVFTLGGGAGEGGIPIPPQDVFNNTILFELPMLSRAIWKFTLGDLVLMVALIALFVEILKATQTRSLAILDHGLSIVVFIICLIEFLLVNAAGTSLFFFITLLALIDVVAGFSVGIRAARRDLTFGGGEGH